MNLCMWSLSHANVVCASHIHGGICAHAYNMKFVCLTLWLGEVCTDDANANTNTGDDEINKDDDIRRTKHDCIRLFG